MKPLRVLLVILLLLPPLLVVALAYYSYDETIDNAFAYGERTAAVLREHALRVVKAQETAINWIDARLEGMSWEEIRQSKEIHKFLRHIRDENEHIDGIWLVPPDGRTANSADYYPVPEVSTLDRRYFQVLSERDITYLGEMIEGKLKGNLNFNISRRRSSPDSSFNGVILVTASLGYLDKFWEQTLGEGPHIVGLLRADGSILGRYPAVLSIPKRIPSDSPFFTLSAWADQASYEFNSATDARDRLYSYARLGDFPAYIAVGLDREAILAPWKRDVQVMAIVAGIGMLVLGLVVARAQRHENQLSAEIQRRRLAEDTVIEKSDHLKAMEMAQNALRTSEERLLAALDAGQMGTFRLDLRTGRLDLYEPMLQLFGLPPRVNPTNLSEFLSLIHVEDRQRVKDAFAEGDEVGAVLKLEFRVLSSDGRNVWLYARSRTHGDAQGRPVYLTGACIDITSRKKDEERQRLISAELDHRVRNTLASIQSILRLTERSAATKEQFTKAVAGRVQAMGRAHGHLSDSSWRGAAFKVLIADELTPYLGKADAEASMDGPDLLLKPAAAVSMALVMHELATNAAKHGALSVPDGKLTINWKISVEVERRALDLEWVERDGPRVTKPSHKGFGNKMLKRILEHEFDARVTLEFPPEGFRLTASFPLDEIVADEGNHPTPRVEKAASSAATESENHDATGARILLAEDEAVLGVHIADTLKVVSVEVIGPYRGLHEATAAALEEDFDAALLDINLAGRDVFPLADVLARKGVPFAFISGYEPGIRPDRFQDRLLLRKPVSDAALLEVLGQLLQSSAGAPTRSAAYENSRRRNSC